MPRTSKPSIFVPTSPSLPVRSPTTLIPHSRRVSSNCAVFNADASVPTTSMYLSDSFTADDISTSRLISAMSAMKRSESMAAKTTTNHA